MPATLAVRYGFLNYWFRPGVAAPTRPTALYLALFTVTPNEATGTAGTEVVGGAYARQLITNVFSDPAVGSGCDNSAIITFPTVTVDWGTVTGFGIFSALTVGTRYFSDLLRDSGGTPYTRAIVVGNTPSFDVGSLLIHANFTATPLPA
jgi:hypothetical protein